MMQMSEFTAVLRLYVINFFVQRVSSIIVVLWKIVCKSDSKMWSTKISYLHRVKTKGIYIHEYHFSFFLHNNFVIFHVFAVCFENLNCWGLTFATFLSCLGKFLNYLLLVCRYEILKNFSRWKKMQKRCKRFNYKISVTFWFS